MANAADFEETLGKLPAKQFARLAKLIAAERARRRANKDGISNEGMMSNREFLRWASDQIASADAEKSKRATSKQRTKPND